MKNQKRKLGSILKIQIDERYHIYGRILKNPSIAFYDLKTDQEIVDIETIISSPILFITGVYNYAISKGRWKIIAHKELEDSLIEPPPRFTQDLIDPNHFRVWYSDGTVKDAGIDECRDMEPDVVWEPEHIEERIGDHYAGRPNKWYESLRIKEK